MVQSTDRGDVKIAGAGTVASGEYGTVTVAGTGILSGDIDCVTLKVSGAGDGRGTLEAESMTVNGSLTYTGDSQTGTGKVNGSAMFHGSLQAQSLAIAGSIDVGKNLTGGEIDLRGFLRVRGDCEVERFTGKAGFKIDGLLNAGAIDISMYGPCSVREIGGEAIVVRSGKDNALRRFVATFLPQVDTRLTAESIEGDDVRLEYTTARVVRGKSVVLGKGCDVALVEYTDEYSAASDAKVKEANKVGEESKYPEHEEKIISD